MAREKTEAARVTTPGVTDGGMIHRFSNGFFAPFQGIGYLGRNPGLLKYALPPALLTGLILALLYSLVVGYTGDLVGGIWTQPDGVAWYSQWLLLPLWYILYASIFVVMMLLGTGLGYVASLPIAGPLNELLSEKVEALETGFEAPFDLMVMLRNMLTTVLHVVAFGLLQLSIWLLASLLNLIPVVGQVITIGVTFITSPLVVGFVPFDYPMTLRLWRFKEKLGFMRRHFALFFGFSVASFLFLYIPFLNLLFLPACVVGATLLTLKMEASGELTTRDRRKEILEQRALRKRQGASQGVTPQADGATLSEALPEALEQPAAQQVNATKS